MSDASEPADDQPIAPSAATPDPLAGGDPFASSLAGLEAHVAAADRAGELVSPQMREMLERLRELSGAVRALTESLGRAPSEGPASDAGPDAR